MHDTPSSGSTSRRLSFDTAATWSLTITTVLAIIIAIPLASVPFFATKTFVLAIGAIVTLVLFIVARLMRGNLSLPHLPLLGALWLVPIAYLLSTLFSGTNLATAFFGVGFSSDTFGLVLIFAVLATLATLILQAKKSQLVFLSGLALAFGIVLVVQVVFLLIGIFAPSVVSPTSNLIGSFVDLGSFVGLGAALGLLTLRFLPVRGVKRALLVVGVLLSLAVLALVNSVIAWALLSIVAFALFVEAIMHVNRNRAAADGESRPLVLPLVTLAVGFLFILGSATLGTALVQSAGTSVIDARPSWQSTFAVGSHTYAVSPLFGAGPGSFGEEWLKHRDRSINDTLFWSVDFTSGIGQIPTSFVTTGVIGALAWLAFFALLLYFGVRSLLMRLPSDPWARFVSVSSFIGALYVLTLAVLALPGPVTYAVGFLLIGLFIASLSTSEDRTLVFSQNPRVGFVIVFLFTLLVLASLGAAYVLVERYTADLAYGQATAAIQRGDLDGAERAVSRAITLAPSDHAYRAGTVVSLARMNQIANDTTLTPKTAQEQFQTVLSNAIAAGAAATAIGPNDYQNWAALGNVYGSLVPLKVSGAYENARDAYARAIALAPTNPVLPFIMAQIEQSNGNTEGAEAYLEDAVTLKRDYTQAILALARLKIEAGKTEEALQAAEAAAYWAPNDPGVLFQAGLLRFAAGDTLGAIEALSRAVQLNPQYANAHFFLGVMYSLTGDYERALAEVRVVAGFSEQNAVEVAADIAALEGGRNPFPTSRLAAFGIPYAPLDEPTRTEIAPAP